MNLTRPGLWLIPVTTINSRPAMVNVFSRNLSDCLLFLTNVIKNYRGIDLEDVLPTEIFISCIFAMHLQSDFLGIGAPLGVTISFLLPLLLSEGSRASSALQQDWLVGFVSSFNLDFIVLNLYFFS